MSAEVIQLLPLTGERRRAATLRNISVGLQVSELTVRATVPTLGNREAALALEEVRRKVELQLTQIEAMVDEFRELAEAEQDESSE